jgi:hypothetical protein
MTPDDRELERLVSETGGVRQRYRESSLDEPPAHLDEAIRAAARREVSARPRLAGSPFSGSWRIPLSIAAVVLVSATVTLMVADRDVHLPGSGDTVRPAPAPRPEEAKERDAPAPQPPASVAKTARQSATPTASGEKGAGVLSDAAVGTESKRREQSAASEAQPAEARAEAKAKAASPAAAPQPEPFPAQANPAAPPPAPAAPADQNVVRRDLPRLSAPAAQPATSPTPARDALSKAEVPREALAAGPRSKDEAALRNAGTPPAAPVSQLGAEGSLESAAPAGPAAEESATARALLPKKQAGPADSDSGPAVKPWERDPKSWLKHVEELRGAGRMEEAKTSFKAFRSRYPDYPLPAGFVVPEP